MNAGNVEIKRPKVIDLFAGAGGFSLGLELAGFDIVLALEIDAWACDTLRFNHPHSKVIQADITGYDLDEIRTLSPENPDLIVGGPPCQGFSIAGPAKKDPADPRNSLFTQFAKWVQCLTPNFFVMENVKGLLSRRNATGEPVVTIIERTFRELGYDVTLVVLNAAEYGVPQLRERLFFVGNRMGVRFEAPVPTHFCGDSMNLEFSGFGTQKFITLWDAISDLPPLAAGQGEEEQEYLEVPQNAYQAWARRDSFKLFNHVAMSHSKRLVERFKQIRCGGSSADVPLEFGARLRNGNGLLSHTAYDQNNRRLHPHSPSHTIAASFYANFVHPFQHRNLTAREGARIQSFPDNYKFFGKKTVVSHRLLHREERFDEKFLCQYNQIGNAVPPLLARAIGTQIIKHFAYARNKRKAGSRVQLVPEGAA